jgi:hypothetical protein
MQDFRVSATLENHESRRRETFLRRRSFTDRVAAAEVALHPHPALNGPSKSALKRTYGVPNAYC